MLYVVDQNGNEFEWHVDGVKPGVPLGLNVKEVQADGHELEWVRDHCTFSGKTSFPPYIPINGSCPDRRDSGVVVRWFDFDAKAIYERILDLK